MARTRDPFLGREPGCIVRAAEGCMSQMVALATPTRLIRAAHPDALGGAP